MVKTQNKNMAIDPPHLCATPLFRAASMIILISLLAVLPGRAAAARETALGLDSDTYYDICIGSQDDGISIIQNVKIVGIREVNDMVFLVVRSDPFSVTAYEGLVLLHYVRAILPSHKITYVPSGQKIRSVR